MAIPLGITSFPSYGKHIPYSTCSAQDTKPTALVDQLLGRQLRPTPRHLSRAVYIPDHGNNTTHLPLYNVTEGYEAAIGDTPIGGCEFKTRLCLMRKPTRNTVDVDVGFLVNVHVQGSFVTVQERCLGVGQEAYMYVIQVMLLHKGERHILKDISRSIPQDPEDDSSISTPDQQHPFSLTTTYPLPAKAVKNTIVEYPYFPLHSQTETELRSFEWQIHPVEHGGLCYTLVDMRLLAKTGTAEDAAVRAIYHHAGMEQDLPQRYSEGILLLPGGRDTVDDAVVVASLFGLLRRVRSRKPAQLPKRSRLGRLGKMIGRSVSSLKGCK